MSHHDYDVRFRARDEGEVAAGAAQRVRDALTALPGIGDGVPTAQGDGTDTVSGAFVVTTRGIQAASRDATRFAKEALKTAGLPEAQLVELWVCLRGEREN